MSCYRCKHDDLRRHGTLCNSDALNAAWPMALGIFHCMRKLQISGQTNHLQPSAPNSHWRTVLLRSVRWRIWPSAGCALLQMVCVSLNNCPIRLVPMYGMDGLSHGMHVCICMQFCLCLPVCPLLNTYVTMYVCMNACMYVCRSAQVCESIRVCVSA